MEWQAFRRAKDRAATSKTEERLMVEESESIGSIGTLGSSDSSEVYDALPGTQPLQAPRGPTAQEIAVALQGVNGRLGTVGRVMELNVDAGTGLTVATIKDAATGEVLQQFPGTGSIHLAQMLKGWASGNNVLLDLIA
jgi:uncharacterized FlaG/YvyC family protein